MRGLAWSFALVLPLLPAACRTKPSPERAPIASASAALAAAPSSEEPAQEGPRNTVRFARCGWGPLKVDRGVDAPPWAIALVDIDVLHPTKGLSVTEIELAGSG